MTRSEILIIEDSPTFAEYLSEVVSKENYKTTTAGTGKKSMFFLQNYNYNLVLLDMELPDCTGIDILKSIRKKYNQTELPVIFVSATTNEKIIIEALEFGANDFISKPFSEITLKIKIKNLLQLHYSSMQLAENHKIQEETNKQLQKLANELSQTNQDKDKFMSILAHDLKNPFSALLGFTDLLLKNLHTYDIEKIGKQIGLINKVSYQTFHLLEDLLLWSKSQSGRLPYEPQEIIFGEICNEVIESLNFQADAKKIKINFFEPEQTVLMADLNMLKTILRNLISNAIKFTHENGIINIDAENYQFHTTITISDNGVGIDISKQSNLFSSAQLYSTIGTANEKGTGLGLLLCKDFVEKHKGKIWLESELGKGSVFKFTMPLHND